MCYCFSVSRESFGRKPAGLPTEGPEFDSRLKLSLSQVAIDLDFYTPLKALQQERVIMSYFIHPSGGPNSSVKVQFGGLNLPTNQVTASDKVNRSAIFKSTNEKYIWS